MDNSQLLASIMSLFTFIIVGYHGLVMMENDRVFKIGGIRDINMKIVRGRKLV